MLEIQKVLYNKLYAVKLYEICPSNPLKVLNFIPETSWSVSKINPSNNNTQAVQNAKYETCC